MEANQDVKLRKLSGVETVAITIFNECAISRTFLQCQLLIDEIQERNSWDSLPKKSKDVYLEIAENVIKTVKFLMLDSLSQ